MSRMMSLPVSEGLFNLRQRLTDRRLNGRQRKAVPRNMRDDHNIARYRERRSVEPIGFPQKALDAVAAHRPAEPAAHGEAETGMRQAVPCGPDCHPPQAEDAAFAEYAVEVALSTQPFPPREALIHRSSEGATNTPDYAAHPTRVPCRRLDVLPGAESGNDYIPPFREGARFARGRRHLYNPAESALCRPNANQDRASRPPGRQTAG